MLRLAFESHTILFVPSRDTDYCAGSSLAQLTVAGQDYLRISFACKANLPAVTLCNSTYHKFSFVAFGHGPILIGEPEAKTVRSPRIHVPIL